MSVDDDVAVRIDGYRNLTRIGGGGFSSVYRAEQDRLGRHVAIKVLDAEITSSADQQTFERECLALGSLSQHPNIVNVYHDAVTDDGRRCIVMELHHGTARDLLRREGRRPVGEVLQLGVKIGSALQLAHDAGIFHRDVKPHNILLSEYGEPALGDFGISVIDVERSLAPSSGLSVAYASPEALDGRRATRASDIYSFGATLYHLLDGEPPFVSASAEAALARIVSESPPELDRADVPESLRAVLRHCLAKAPSGRPASAADVVTALRDIEAELGFDRTPVPLRRADGPAESRDPHRGPDPDHGDAATIGRAGSAMRAAGTPAPSTRASGDTSAPSSTLWPPGWSPQDLGGDDTIERTSRSRSATTGHGDVDGTPTDTAQSSRDPRLLIGLAVTSAVIAVAVAVAVLLLG